MTAPANATTTEQAIAVMEEFRTNMRAIGQATPAVEQFINEMNLLIAAYGNPTTAMDALFHSLAEKRPDNPAVAKVTGARA